MHIIQYTRKGRMMNALENFHIYDTTIRGIQINDRMTVQKKTASNVPIVAIDVTTSLSLTGNRDWVLCIEYEVFI